MVILDRRTILAGAGLLGLGGCATMAEPQQSLAPRRPTLPPIRAGVERLFDITVCLRPFRASGPRLDTETIGDALIVHNYGHGGSGWSLSWGSGTIAVEKAMAGSPKEVAVIGCGALGLTSAILAQEAGARVTIYAKDLLPDTRSARATGSWTPDSRIALTSAATPAFGDLWEQMARISWKRYRRYLGLPGTPVEFTDRYFLAGGSDEYLPPPNPLGRFEFAEYSHRIRDLVGHSVNFEPEASPFPGLGGRMASQLQFNIADYAHTLMLDFLAAGGRFERREFHAPAELGQLKEKVVIHCTGYAARALFKDESVVPVRGQIGWLIPQAEVRYGVYYRGVSALSRRDGIVVQQVGGGDMVGYGDDREVINREESERGVRTLAELYARTA
jgi:glycine/D-amino acid oxidase-like deaminating enzyme